MALIIRDTFSGAAGNILAHTSDSGAAWNQGYWTSVKFDLNGLGQLARIDDINGMRDAWALVEMPSSDYFVEADVTIPEGSSSSVILYSRIQTEPNPEYGAEDGYFSEMEWYPDDGDIYLMSQGSGGDYALFSIPPQSGNATVRMEVSGNSMTVLIGGVTVGSTDISGLPLAGYTGLGCWWNGDSDYPCLTINEFRAGTLGGTAFWTNKVGTTEVFA